MSALPHHYEASALVQATVERVFAYVDDPTHLSSHMSKSSWMMAGSRMQIELDDDRGQRVGSRIRMSGRIFGLRLSREEVVTEYNFPHREVLRYIPCYCGCGEQGHTSNTSSYVKDNSPLDKPEFDSMSLG